MEHTAIVDVDPPVFSRDDFNRLTLMDDGLQRQLIEAFLKQGATLRAELVDTARSSQGGFRDSVHRLKGSCHYMGALRLLRVLGSLNPGIDFNTAEERVDVARRILQELGSLEGALSAVLGEPKDA
jgi:hypothetical protein